MQDETNAYLFFPVAHHIADMYHHYNFRGAYTKTLTPSGAGEIAARVAVGLDSLAPLGENSPTDKDKQILKKVVM
jgi:hypothetical protein